MLITWAESSVTVAAGDSVDVSFVCGQDFELLRTITTTDAGVATITQTGSGFNGVAHITGVSAGTVTTVPGGSDTQAAPLTITVTVVDDESYLNKRGLTHFWENIDDIKQDKMEAMTNAEILSIYNGNRS